MDILAAMAIIVPAAVSVFHAYLAYKKSKEPARDPVWDAALQITIHDGNACDVDTFAENYEKLSQFKAYGCSLHGKHTIAQMVKANTQEGMQSQAPQNMQAKCHEVQK